MSGLAVKIQELEQGALQAAHNQCNNYCFLDNCNNCAVGRLYQAATLRHHIQRVQPGFKLPPLPVRLYKKTIKFLEQ